MEKKRLKKMLDVQTVPAEHFKEIMDISEMGGGKQITAVRLFLYGKIIGLREARKK